MADQNEDGLTKLFLRVVEATAWYTTYGTFRFLCTFWEWDIGLARKLKALSEAGLTWAEAKKNDFKENGSALVRKYERSHGQEPTNYEALAEFQEVSPMVSIVENDPLESQSEGSPGKVADGKGAGVPPSLSTVQGDSDNDLEGNASPLDHLTEGDTVSFDDEVTDTPDTKAKANDAA